MQIFSAEETRRLLALPVLMRALEQVLGQYDRGAVVSPQRLAMPCGPNNGGVLLSMPCRSHDLLIHKLLTVYGANPAADRPAIQGHVTAFDAGSGTPLFSLDGPTVTACRTAAISMIGIAQLRSGPPTAVTVIGTGTQAEAHVAAVLELYPSAEVRVRGTSPAKEAAFAARFAAAGGQVAPHRDGDPQGDVVIAATGSLIPVYEAAPQAGRLVVGVGAYRLDMVEIGARTISGSQIYVDDPIGAPSEAGDIAAAGTPWSEVRPLARALVEPPDFERPIFFKSVGCAAWDLAACRVARSALDL